MNKNIFKYKLKRFFRKPYDAIKSTVLCLRFPFLYPRNRWNDKHYTNWRLEDYWSKNHEKAYKWVIDEEISKRLGFPSGNWVLYNKWWGFKLKVSKILNGFISIFHIIPLYTELDAMPNGWRKCFGIQMCKEIKQALLRDGRKVLKNYRIEQIKEKFGGLRWYDEHFNDEVASIVKKYEYISERTCSVCGRPAKYLTRGWIEPYCEKCVPEKQKDSAQRYLSDIPFYGYTDMEYYEKHKNDKKVEENN